MTRRCGCSPLLREPFYVALSNTLQHAELLQLKEHLAEDNRELQRDLRKIVGTEIIGASFGLASTMDLVRKVAPRDSPVLLLGETGTGKDVIAQAIHAASPRRAAPFVKVNAGAIPPSLIDSELFGHEKGAFTGAQARKRGRFERAHQGTLFLDEIGELPPEAQVRLLRVLQDHTIERVGGTEAVRVDVRILAATHRNLGEMIEEGEFREDLWFRLAVFPIELAPLRERVMDIPALASHFLSRKARALRLPTTPELAPGAIEPLLRYDWPGNVRELENVIERALILDPKGPLQFDSLLPGQKPRPSSRPPSPRVVAHRRTLDDVMADHIRAVLRQTAGRVQGQGGAAEVLGVHPSTLRSKMRKLGIVYGRAAKTGA
jgi:transcriptional regulator with GAF, ATPase, and Fis domain